MKVQPLIVVAGLFEVAHDFFEAELGDVFEFGGDVVAEFREVDFFAGDDAELFELGDHRGVFGVGWVVFH